MYNSLFLCFLLCVSVKAQLLCDGKIIELSNYGIQIEIHNKSKEDCWVEDKSHPYYIKRTKKTVVIKLAPPTDKIESDEAKTVFISEPRGGRKIKLLKEIDSLIINWIGTNVDSSYIEIAGKKINTTDLNPYFPEGSTYEPFTYIKKGDRLIIDIQCADEESGKKPLPFHINKPIYPFLRCEIAPAERDYSAE